MNPKRVPSPPFSSSTALGALPQGERCFVNLLMDQLINLFNYLLIFEPFPGDGAALGEFMAAGVKGEFAQQSKAPCVVLLASRLLINHIPIPSCLQHTGGIQGWDTGQVTVIFSETNGAPLCDIVIVNG